MTKSTGYSQINREKGGENLGTPRIKETKKTRLHELYLARPLPRRGNFTSDELSGFGEEYRRNKRSSASLTGG